MNSADLSRDLLHLDTIRELREQVKALEARLAEAMDFARFAVDYSSDPHVVSAARRLVEKEDGRG